MSSIVITANRLTDGVVVFLAPGSGWVSALAEAAVFSGASAEDALRRAKDDEDRQIVVEPYPVDVVPAGSGVIPKTLREKIRAVGPTVRPDLNAGA